jgi:hypothetical protein
MPRDRWPIMVAMLGAAGGCGVEQGDAPPASVEERPLPPPPSERPDRRTDTLMIEGVAQPVEVRLVESPAAFPLPFTTYIPPDLRVEEADRGDQAEVRFVADFGTAASEDAWLEIAAYPTGISADEALERARRAAGETARRVAEGEPVQGWTLAEWRITSADPAEPRTGRVLLGRHRERHFHVRIQHPPEFGDGFGPRVGLVLHNWRWNDGTPLTTRAATPR